MIIDYLTQQIRLDALVGWVEERNPTFSRLCWVTSWCSLGGGTEPNILKILLGYAIATPNLLAVNRQQPYITERGGVVEKLSALTPLVPRVWKYAGEIRRLKLVVG